VDLIQNPRIGVHLPQFAPPDRLLRKLSGDRKPEPLRSLSGTPGIPHTKPRRASISLLWFKNLQRHLNIGFFTRRISYIESIQLGHKNR
jgi:hypothetical protein